MSFDIDLAEAVSYSSELDYVTANYDGKCLVLLLAEVKRLQKLQSDVQRIIVSLRKERLDERADNLGVNGYMMLSLVREELQKALMK